MLKIIVELDKFGRGKEIKKLTELQIINTGTGSSTAGNYEARVLDKNGKVCRKAEINNHRRKDKSVLNLVFKALKELNYDI